MFWQNYDSKIPFITTKEIVKKYFLLFWADNLLYLSKIYVMEVNEQLILKLEKLSRLKLQAEERKQMQSSLQQVLAMVDKLNEVNTEGIEPLTHISDAVNVLREDVVLNQLTNEQAMQNAPKTMDNYFAVPKFVHKE